MGELCHCETRCSWPSPCSLHGGEGARQRGGGILISRSEANWRESSMDPPTSSAIADATDLRSPHFQLPPQNPMQQPEQREHRSDQHHGVENENVDLHSKVPLFLTKKYVRAGPAPIVTLFHLRIRNQVGNFLIQI